MKSKTCSLYDRYLSRLHVIHTYTYIIIQKWLSQGGCKLQLENIHGIVIHGNEVYVAKYVGDRIHKFTTDGKFLDMFGDYGDEVGKFNNPHDVIKFLR